MFVRLPFLLALLLSLAFGPVRLAVACASAANTVSCHSCCAEAGMACCSAADRSTPAKAPDSVAPHSPEGKRIVSPQLVLVGFCPLPAVERAAAHHLQAARMPAPSRLALTCIRLI